MIPFNIGYILPDNDCVRLLSQLVEEMDLTILYGTYWRLKEKQASPRTMLKLVLYAYLEGKYSSREMEKTCRRNINYMYLPDGKPVPDHAAFAGECIQAYGLWTPWHKQVRVKNLKKLRRKLYAIKEDEGITFVHRTGKSKSGLQKHIEILEFYMERLGRYANDLHICGEHNSYSKTDYDATFMLMKEDAMKNGQLKVGYNLQHGIDSEYIVWLAGHLAQDPQPALKPFLKNMEANLSFTCKNIVADAGYESEENYIWIEENGQTTFIKPTNYELSRTGKYQKDISRRENMDYYPDEDYYLCKTKKRLTAVEIKNRKSKAGYLTQTTIYRCEDCTESPYKTSCTKGKHWKLPLEERTKQLEVSRNFERQRSECLERIVSDEGILLRINRSIQAEGSFADMKQDCNFRRYLCREQKNVYAEGVLMAISHSIEKLHYRIQKEWNGLHLFYTEKAALFKG